MFDLSRYNLPHEPGCYIYKDSEGAILYIGKAKDLKKRVSSYFNHPQEGKTAELVKRVADLELIIVRNELESWILEARLIRQHKPPFNIELKDGERFSWIVLTNEEYPRAISTRKKNIKGTYFGPFASAENKWRLLNVIKKLYKLRSCPKLPKHSCLYYDVGLCSAPCIQKISKEHYMENVKQASLLLKGKARDLAQEYKEKMDSASARQSYELAREYRDAYLGLQSLVETQVVEKNVSFDQHVIVFDSSKTQISILVLTLKKGVITSSKPYIYPKPDDPAQFLNDFLIRYYGTYELPDELVLESEPVDKEFLTTTLLELHKDSYGKSALEIVVPHHGTKKELVFLAKKNAIQSLVSEYPALEELQKALDLESLPLEIECFDISNLGDQFIVASMVHFSKGKPNKSQYRKFKIRSTEFQNDFAAMKEVVYRRYKRLIEEKAELPDLIVIDGGPPQLLVATESLDSLFVETPCISLAKEFELIYSDPKKEPLALDNKSRALLLLRHIRDEAHRFAVSYNRKLREKSIKT